jgi:hypothetical protein
MKQNQTECKLKRMECRTENMPRIVVKSYDGGLPECHLKHSLHPELLRKSQFHEETLARLGLTR